MNELLQSKWYSRRVGGVKKNVGEEVNGGSKFGTLYLITHSNVLLTLLSFEKQIEMGPCNLKRKENSNLYYDLFV